MCELPTGTVTLLFTDIEGSTYLLQQLGDRYVSLLEACRSLLRAAFLEFHGREVDTQGDAFFVAFARATDAIAAAVAGQRAILTHAWPKGVTVRVRMGLHTGEPSVATEGYVGMDVHHAARIMSAGHGGQVLLSQTTRDLVGHTLSEEVSLMDLGVHRLKDLQQPSHLFQLVISGLPADFPPLKTLDTQPNNLPIQPTPFIGRAQEVAAVAALLRREDVRLVTLTGPGGTGKTRLGLQVAAELSEVFPDGVFFVNLAPLSDPAFVLPAIAQVLDVKEMGAYALLDLLQAFLREKQLLLLLDNFEQVVRAALPVAELLAACPKLKIVVTSRMTLHVRAEHEFAVPPLALPNLKRLPDLVALSQYDAVALFIQRAQAVKFDFQVTNTTAPAVAEICVRLDGLPLAIELAAARIKLLPPGELLARLGQRLAVLTSGARDAPTRQQTLRNTIDWSYHLLDAQEQQLFRRLSVFVGGCTLEAGEAVCATLGDGAGQVVEGVASLIDKSLLQQTEHEGNESRLVMLETIREYGWECLTVSEEEETTRQAHAEYYLALAEEAEPHLRGAQQLLWLRQLEQEQENLRTALGWLIASEEVEIALHFCVALWWFWQTRVYWSEGRRWLKAVLALRGAGERTTIRARTLSAAGELAGVQGDWREAHMLLSESVALYRELGDERGLVLPLSTLGWVLLRQGDLAAAAPLMEESIALCRKLGHNWDLSRVLLWLGNIASFQGDLMQAMALTQEGLTLARELGDMTLIARALNNLGYFLWLHGDLMQAMALTQEGLTLARELGDKFLILSTVETLGSIVLSQGDPEQAKALFTEGFSLAKELGNDELIALLIWGLARVAAVKAQLKHAARLFGAAAVRYDINKVISPDQRDDYEQTVESVRARLGEQAFAVAWAEGRTMTIEQILEAPEPVTMLELISTASSTSITVKPPPGPTYPDDLTAREEEVLRLVAQGMTNQQVAEQLIISPRTVNTHLTSIYGKIRVSSRSAATRYAIEHHLV